MIIVGFNQQEAISPETTEIYIGETRIVFKSSYGEVKKSINEFFDRTSRPRLLKKLLGDEGGPA